MDLWVAAYRPLAPESPRASGVQESSECVKRPGGVEFGVEACVQEEAVADSAEQGCEGVGWDVRWHGAAFLAVAGEVCHGSAKVVHEIGQALAQIGVALGFEHRLGTDPGYELLLLGLLTEVWLEQRDEIGQLLECAELFDRERLLEHEQCCLGEQLLLAAEVVADRPVREIRPHGNGARRDPPPSQFSDQLGGGTQQTRARVVGRRCPFADRLSIWTVHLAKSIVEWPKTGGQQVSANQDSWSKTMTPTLAIEATGLTRSFGRTRAVDGLDLTVPQGIVYGLLGPNGAGKTTTIRMLATLLRPDGGTARVFGHDVVRDADAVRRHIGLTGQFASIDNELTGLENLVLLGRLLGLPRQDARVRARELLETFDLADAGGRQVMSLSGGMRRRLDIAASLIRRPSLLFLDEPTTGLDPRSRQQTWEIVRAIVAQGTTVVLTTQYLDEADQLSDRVAVIDHGSVIAEGTSAELKASVGAGAFHVRLHDPTQRSRAQQLLVRELHTAIRPTGDPAALSARISPGDGALELGARTTRALAELTAAGITVDQFALAQPTLDEAFLALTGQPAHPTTADTDT
jgi:ABC-2 type transport system ATP-binding protein